MWRIHQARLCYRLYLLFLLLALAGWSVAALQLRGSAILLALGTVPLNVLCFLCALIIARWDTVEVWQHLLALPIREVALYLLVACPALGLWGLLVGAIGFPITLALLLTLFIHLLSDVVVMLFGVWIDDRQRRTRRVRVLRAGKR